MSEVIRFECRKCKKKTKQIERIVVAGKGNRQP